MKWTSQEEPCASITTNKNRIKTYGKTVYLKDKQEFEIEIFNPSTITRLAKIYINGTLISNSGLVIKPGQRIYLERFIDSPKKFKFETYEVNGTSTEVLKAIQNNGEIKVCFYDEYIPRYYYKSANFVNINNDWQNNTPVTYTTSSIENTLNKTRTKGTIDQMSFFSTSVDNLDQYNYKNQLLSEKKETGRVEQGSTSNQSFTNYSGSFNSWVTKVETIKILPFSEKPLENKDLASYCTECGTKNKGGKYKFCPSCGHKF